MAKLAAFVILIIIVIAAPTAVAAPVETGDLLELINPDGATYLRDSVCTQVSSFDRTGDNDDGFSGKYSFERKEGENLVIFDHEGPGCVYRLWSANPEKGWVKFYFDGEETPRLQFDHFEDMFTDKKYPFVPPLSQHFLGGWTSYVPMPFVKSLKIVAGGPVYFLQITWHKFPSAEGVKTFDPNYSPEDRAKFRRVKNAWSRLGEPPAALGGELIKKTITVRGNSTAELAKLTGSGRIRSIKIKAESIDAKFLRKSLILVNVEGQKTPNVYSPLGDFFLDPFGAGRSQSLLTGKKDDTYYSYWVMPYGNGATVKVRNDSRAPLKLTYEVTYDPAKSLDNNVGRFFAWWHRQNPTIEGKLFPILDATGRGQWMGVSHAMQGGGQGLGFLEGDEMAWIDDRDNTFYNGTGTEDYFNGGWYFGDVGSASMYGCGVLEGAGKCHAYRIQMNDCVPFQQKATIGIEHGHGNTIPADYSGVTFWYAAPGTKHGFAPVPMLERLDRPASIPHVTEAEKALAPNSGGKVISDEDQAFYLSSGQGVTTSKPGGSFTLSLDAPDSDEYDVEIGFLKGPDQGACEILLDGRSLGKVDTKSDKIDSRARVRVGVTPEIAKGQHKLTIKSIGNNVLVDFFAIRSARNYEGERMAVLNVTGGEAHVQDLGGFSEGAHRFFTATKVGATLDLRFKVGKAGTYPVSAYLTKAGDYGIVQLKIDGKPIGQPFDGYNDGVTRELAKFGEVQLSAGDHTLTMEITGKNDKSVGYYAGLDVLSLK